MLLKDGITIYKVNGGYVYVGPGDEISVATSIYSMDIEALFKKAEERAKAEAEKDWKSLADNPEPEKTA